MVGIMVVFKPRRRRVIVARTRPTGNERKFLRESESTGAPALD